MKPINPEIKAKIFAAAEALVAEGVESPTNDAVRDRMGGGSLTHISPVMREWKASRREQVRAVLALPDELLPVIRQAGAQLWSALTERAQLEIGEVKADAAERIAEATAERDELLSEVERLEGEGRAKDEAIAQLKAENARLLEVERHQSVVTALLNDRDAALSELRNSVEDARIEAARQQERAELLDSQLTKLQAGYDALQKQLLALAKKG